MQRLVIRMKPLKLTRIGCFLMVLALGAGHSLLEPGGAHAGTKLDIDRLFLLPEERIVTGTIQHVKSGVIQVNIGGVEPLFLSTHAASAKGMGFLKPGDKLTIIISKENEPIDFHLADQPGWDVAVKGRLLQPLLGDLRWVILQVDWGTNEPFEVADSARHAVQNIPVGVPAMFLLNGHNVILDATYGEDRIFSDTLMQWSKDRP